MVVSQSFDLRIRVLQTTLMEIDRVYRSDNRFDSTSWQAMRAIVDEVWRFRFQVMVAFKRDFRAAYTGTLLGRFWNIFLPLLPILVYLILALTRVVPNFDTLDPILAITLNATLWFFFVGCVQTPVTIVQSRNAEAMKTSVALSVSIVAGFGRVIFEFLLRLAIVVGAIVWTQTLPQISAIGGLGLFLLSSMFFLSIGLLLAIINIAVPDLQKITGVVLGYGIFLSGVIFPLEAFGPLAILEDINPFAIWIANLREAFFVGWPQLDAPLVCMILFTLLSVPVSMRVFYIMEKRIRGVVV